MKIIDTFIEDVKILVPNVYEDIRGFFFESYNKKTFKDRIGYDVNFVQDNHSQSTKGVLRGLHYQLTPYAQDKLVSVVQGEIFDVAVDLRRSSPTFGKWISEILSQENKKQLWIPKGFAHGFQVLSERANITYKVTDYYEANSEQVIIWNDKSLNINWPLTSKPKLSNKDKSGISLNKAKVFK